jgi:hypothetical protein
MVFSTLGHEAFEHRRRRKQALALNNRIAVKWVLEH